MARPPRRRLSGCSRPEGMDVHCLFMKGIGPDGRKDTSPKATSAYDTLQRKILVSWLRGLLLLRICWAA